MRRLGVYWSVSHRRPQDYAYFKALQPTVFKIMDGGRPDYDWAQANLPNSLIVARDWAMSEQKDDMRRDPVGTGRRHAEEWHAHQPRLGFNPAKTLILGINEPSIWEAGIADALRAYTTALCDRAAELNLRVGAMQLSVGWPGNNGPDMPPNWSPFAGVEAAIRRGNHALVLHEYWADSGPGENWGWWAGRSLKCPWRVPIVIGECGVDMFVKDSTVQHNSRGWQGRMHANRYAAELAEYTVRMSTDPRFVGCCPFASDYANREWFSFDVEPAYDAILAATVPHVDIAETYTLHLPTVVQPAPQPQPAQPPATVPPLRHPVVDARYRRVSQGWGARPEYYSRFVYNGVPLKGHNGIDYATPIGTPIRAVDGGRVVEAQFDEGWGNYIKIAHSWGESLYAHLQTFMVVAGAVVAAAQPIALSGNSGNSTGPHLHYGMRITPYERGDGWGGFTDPTPYLAAADGESPVDPQPPANIVATVREAAREFGVDENLLLSLIWKESSYNPRAVNQASGAKGLGQVMPLTWQEWSVKTGATDIWNARDNARVSAAYLNWCIQTAGSERRGLWAYVWGIGRTLDLGKPGKPTQPPPEVIEYANTVLHGRDLLDAVMP